MQITLSISQTAVYAAVDMHAAYTGAKMDADPGAFARIATTQADREMLARFWDEAASQFSQALRKSISHQSTIGTLYQVVLEVSASFDEMLVSTMQSALFDYFTAAITTRWFAVSNREQVPDFAATAATLLGQLQRNSLAKKAPSRPVY
ncbi:MAG: hypothetical protein LIP03_09365 [Bacteroidales bacterium]|nr:hypothetical protein [Bacteroidales bacterium]